MDRRQLLRITAAAALFGAGCAITGRRPVSAQEAATLAELGLPELTVTLTDAGFAVAPSETPGGWTLVTFDNQLPEDNFNGADLMQLPTGQTVADLMSSLATPTAETPAWVYETTWAGGPMGVGGTSSQAAVLLTAGDWMVWSAGEPYAPAALTVTVAGDAAPAAPAVAATVEVEMQEFAFVGLETGVAAGPRVWKVTTTGEQPHVLVLLTAPAGTTTEQVLNAFMGMMSGTPSADAVDLSAVRPVGGCGSLSAGQTAWSAIDLAAGTYAAVCFVPDQATGAPHIALGMGTVFTVA